VVKGGDGVYEPKILIGGGFPVAEGSYATIAAPNLLKDLRSAGWVKRYAARKQPNDYCITTYDAVLVIADAIGLVASYGKAYDPRRDARCDQGDAPSHTAGHERRPGPRTRHTSSSISASRRRIPAFDLGLRHRA
jgi:hypothetical protein